MPDGKPKKALPMELKSLARAYTEQAIQALGGIMINSENPQAVVSAANSLLDRGWGKSAQPHTGEDGEGPLEIVLRTIVEERQKAVKK